MPNRVTDLARRDIAPDVPIAAAVNVLQAAAGRADPEALCASVGLTAARLAEPDARMPYRQLAALYEHAARHTGDRWFGLRVGAGIDLRSFGLTGYLALSSPTLADALASLARYLPLWTDGAALQLDRARAPGSSCPGATPIRCPPPTRVTTAR